MNLEYLAEAAKLLMGPNGALQLSVFYATIENVAKRAFEEGYSTCLSYERRMDEAHEEEEIAEAYRVADELQAVETASLLTLNEAAHGDDHDVADSDLHKTHYDTWNGRFHRPGEE